MALGMKIKEQMIREFTPSQEDITEVGGKLDEIRDTINNMGDLIFDEEGPEYIAARKDLTNTIVNIGYIKKALGLR